MDFLSRLICMMLLFVPLRLCLADPDPLQDFCVAELTATPSIDGFPCKDPTSVTSDDFFFDGLAKYGNTNSTFGFAATPGNVLFFPGINTLGLSINRLDFAPGGLNPPHSHPRASEAVLCIGGQLLVGFVTTGNKYFSKVLTPGQLFIIPRGVVHFQLNVGKVPALAFTAFNSQLPGAVVLPTTLFVSNPSIPDEVLTKGFKIDSNIINTIRTNLGG